MKKTMHPQIEKMVRLYENEEQPFRKIHRMVDLFEVIIKTHTVFIMSTYFVEQHTNIGDNCKFKSLA